MRPSAPQGASSRRPSDGKAEAARVDDLEPHRAFLWGLAYRMTGVAADADDVVQDAMTRALLHPPARDRPLRPWLVTVTMNRARDVLRRRRRSPYVGPWLPSPVDDGLLAPTWDGPTPERCALLRESTTLAFLLALERLTPLRRAVLVLRDVFDYSTEETADALGISPDNVKQTLARARRAFATDERPHTRRSFVHEGRRETEGANANDEGSRRAIERFLAALASGDAKEVEKLLAADVEAHSDSGGTFVAARVVVRGAGRVATLYGNLRRFIVPEAVALRPVNGRWAIVARLAPSAQIAPRVVLSASVDENGRIDAIYSVVAPQKLTAVAPL